MVALFTVTARCRRLWGGVVLITVFWGMLSRLTGVGGALSERGREMPAGEQRELSVNSTGSDPAAQSVRTFVHGPAFPLPPKQQQ